MGDNIRSEYLDFWANAKAFREQVGSNIELVIECDGNEDCPCRKSVVATDPIAGGIIGAIDDIVMDDGLPFPLGLFEPPSHTPSPIDEADDVAFWLLPIPVAQQGQLPPAPPPTEVDFEDDLPMIASTM